VGGGEAGGLTPGWCFFFLLLWCSTSARWCCLSCFFRRDFRDFCVCVRLRCLASVSLMLSGSPTAVRRTVPMAARRPRRDDADSARIRRSNTMSSIAVSDVARGPPSTWLPEPPHSLQPNGDQRGQADGAPCGAAFAGHDAPVSRALDQMTSVGERATTAAITPPLERRPGTGCPLGVMAVRESSGGHEPLRRISYQREVPP
jgi:hypothetical protein